MTDSITKRTLQDIVRREGRSLLQYIRDAFPWITIDERKAWTDVRALADEEQQATAALSKFLARRRITVPYLGSYAESFTTLNYVALEHLLPMLADYERQTLAALERDHTRLKDPEARDRVQSILDMKRRHLQALEALAAAYPETASTLR